MVNLLAYYDLGDLEPDRSPRTHRTARHGGVQRSAVEVRHLQTSVLVEGSRFGL